MEFLSLSRRRETSHRRRARRDGYFRRLLGLSLHRGSVVITIAVQEKSFVTCISMNSRGGFVRKVFFFFYPRILLSSNFWENKERKTPNFVCTSFAQYCKRNLGRIGAIAAINCTGAPNENIPQNHLNIALLNVFLVFKR